MKIIDKKPLVLAVYFFVCFAIALYALCVPSSKEVSLIYPYASVGLLYVTITGMIQEFVLATNETVHKKYKDWYEKREDKDEELNKIQQTYSKWMRRVIILGMILGICILLFIDSPIVVLFSVFFLAIMWTPEFVLFCVLCFHKEKDSEHQHHDTPKMA